MPKISRTPTSRCPPSCSRRHVAVLCAGREDRRRPGSTPLSVPQRRSLRRRIKDRVSAQEKITPGWAEPTKHPSHVAYRTQPTTRSNSERDSFALRTAGGCPLDIALNTGKGILSCGPPQVNERATKITHRVRGRDLTGIPVKAILSALEREPDHPKR